ncbi:MAG: PhzF family phenazine biosynthesis protein [Bdellovibrionales bacterium]|nr:PhzF family phenazine biosynthesis protein [Bdellovibrionales bacterium]
MDLTYYQINSFATSQFAGNPAGVCPLAEWLPDDVMQEIARERGVSETAFLVGGNGRYQLRWFTPTVEIDLCGHATLAAAGVVFAELEPTAERVSFDTASGELTVTRSGELLEMNFPAWEPEVIALPPELRSGLGASPREVLANARDVVAVFEHEDEVLALQTRDDELMKLPYTLVIATAPSTTHDFVCRVFAPNAGISEDPVTGSAFSTLGPYWVKRLGKESLAAVQRSERGGEVLVEELGERVLIRGRVVEDFRSTLALEGR